MRRPKEEPVVRNNNVVTAGQHNPDQFFSGVNTSAPGCKSILQANTQARAIQKEQEHAMRHGAWPSFDPKIHEIRSRYRKEIVDAGQATKDKCCDEIC